MALALFSGSQLFLVASSAQDLDGDGENEPALCLDTRFYGMDQTAIYFSVRLRPCFLPAHCNHCAVPLRCLGGSVFLS